LPIFKQGIIIFKEALQSPF